MTAIIILNWNGAQDTIECIDSICQIEDDYFCTIVDNGSEDDSVESIIQHLSRKGILHSIVERGGEQPSTVSNHEFIVYKNGVNMGFAKGNNEAIRLISKFRPDTYLLLNNDTIVEKDFLHSLTQFSKDHSEYKVLTPLIFYYYDKESVDKYYEKIDTYFNSLFSILELKIDLLNHNDIKSKIKIEYDLLTDKILNLLTNINIIVNNKF